MKTEIANEICINYFKEKPNTLKRFETGLANYVYLASYDTDKYVIRISRDDIEDSNTTYWIDELTDLNIPIPRVIHKGKHDGHPYLILNHIEGDDLAHIYKTLSNTEKMEIAKSIIEIQNKVSTLRLNNGFGCVAKYGDSSSNDSWKDVVLGDLARSKSWIIENRLFDVNKVTEVEELLNKFDDYFQSIKPIPFLDDTTTKNVLINNGKLSGVIDLDWICFGDRLYFIALTNMALINSLDDTKYIDYLIEEQKASDFDKAIIKLYTLVFCVIFMSEKGMRFNKKEAPKVDETEIVRLNAVYDRLYSELTQVSL
jgi:hypothetical protein